MRAAVLVEPGHIEMQERPIPTPMAGDVMIRVSSVGVCGSDTHYYRDGRVGGFVVDAPLVLGHEAAGTIVGVGDSVDRTRIGQRVSIEPQRPDPDTRRGAATTTSARTWSSSPRRRWTGRYAIT